MKCEKKQFVLDLQIENKVDSIFMVSRKLIRKKKDGNDYCLLTLQDKGGEIQGVLWTDALNKNPDFSQGDIVHVQGIVSRYRDSKQVTVNQLKKVDLDKKYYSDYIRTTKKDINKMFSELLSMVETVKNKHLRQLLKKFFKDKKFGLEFCHATAAVHCHHAYRGGLLEHTLSVCKVCDLAAGVYPNVDRDLLIAGALLHDIGKIKEYDVGMIIKVTDQGKLLGHISMGYSWVLDVINSIKDFPGDLRERILHIILSHHGYKEFGSPVLPKIMEAFIVHHIDYMDAQVAAYDLLLENGNDEDWSHFIKSFERSVLLRKYEPGGMSGENRKINDKEIDQKLF